VEFEEEKEEEGEERKQEAAERKEAGAASQGLQGRGLSQQKDTEDHLPDESSDERTSSKAHKKKGEDQGGSACKTEPWATGAKEAGAVAAGVGVKFGNLSVGGGEAETVTGAEAGSGSGEGDDVFKSMDAECTVYMQESKVRQHHWQVAYSVDDLYFD
jgi:hypothetical protein